MQMPVPEGLVDGAADGLTDGIAVAATVVAAAVVAAFSPQSVSSTISAYAVHNQPTVHGQSTVHQQTASFMPSVMYSQHVNQQVC